MSSILKDDKGLFFTCFRDREGKQCKKATKVVSKKAAAEELASFYSDIAMGYLGKEDGDKRLNLVIKKLSQLLAGKELVTVLKQLDKVYRALSKKYYAQDEVYTLVDVSQKWLRSKRSAVKVSTYTSYCVAIKDFLIYVKADSSKLLINDFKTHILNRYAEYLTQEFSIKDKTVKGKMKSIKAMLKYAYQMGYAREDFGAKYKHVSNNSEPSKRRGLTDLEFFKFLELAKPYEDWHDMIIIAGLTGQRLGDIVTAKHSDLTNVENGQFWQFTTIKTGRKMEVPLLKEVAEVFRRRSLNGSQYLFPEQQSKYMQKDEDGRDRPYTASLSNWFNDHILVPAGLSKFKHSSKQRKTGKTSKHGRNQSEVTFHSLRHTAVRRFHEAGIPKDVVMDIIGHDDETVHNQYLKHTRSYMLEQMQKLSPPVTAEKRSFNVLPNYVGEDHSNKPADDAEASNQSISSKKDKAV